MITPAWAQMMAAYNTEMNRRLYTAAARLTEAERHRDAGAFFGSVHATLAHLLWGDRQWMSRFDGWAKNTEPSNACRTDTRPFETLTAERADYDAAIAAWTHRLDQAWLDQDLIWYSGAAGREMRKSRTLLVTHFFNHQTHHRGQVHALLTAAGQQTEDTDLMLIV